MGCRPEDLFSVAPNGVAFVQPWVRPGVLPRMLSEILNTRIMVKQAMKRAGKAAAAASAGGARAGGPQAAPGGVPPRVLKRVLDARQYSLKMIANVTYGYTSASFSGRMPCSELADSIVESGEQGCV